MTDNLASRIANLSPEKRALLEKLLKQRGVDLNQSLIIPVKRDGSPLPLSFAQQRLWFLDQLEPNSPIYNIPTAVRLSGKLDVGALDATLDALVQRHESLRTTFSEHAGSPVQVIAPQVSLPLVCVDLTGLPVASREAEAMRLAMEEARKPFNLAEGPLLRATLLRLDEAEHILLLTMHHIISDGWSMGVLVREMAALYQAFAAGQPSPLPELPIQYADYAHWQREWLQGEVLEKQLAYWRERLGDEPPVLELPTDRPRPAVRTNRGASLTATLPARLLQDLNALARQEGVTLFMVLLAAFQTLLSRYSGQTDISVGTPIAGRRRPEIENLIGVFINTLVMRTDLSGKPTFRELLARVKEVALGAYAHQDIPFEMLVEKLQPERDMSRSPFFQVMLILQNAPTGGFELPALALEQIPVDPGTATFDITFSAVEMPEGLHLTVEYNTDLFDEATIRRMVGHFETLLGAAAAAPDTRITDLPLLTEAERQQILVEWNDTKADFDYERCLHELFEEQAARTPDATAVVVPAYGGEERQSLTYAELNERANRLAHTLRAKGVGPDTIVAIATERRLEMIVGLLGVLKAGGAYLPIDPIYPPDRIQYMLSDSGACVLLTQAHLIDRLPPHEADTLRLDADWEAIAQAPADNPPLDVKPNNLAYVIYTSGSTGQSKGVMIEHRSIVNVYLGWEEAYRLRTDARSHLQMASFSFDVFTGDLSRALCSGGKLVLAPREWLLDPERLYALMRAEEVDAAEFVPVVLRTLAQYLDETGQKLDFMRLLICGSDMWYVEEYRRFRRLCGPQTRLINSFGLTEATIDSSYFEGPVDHLPADRAAPIGRPFANQQFYVLDENRQPVPVRVPGELYVGGVALARGYLNRPDLTAERFVPHPFSDEPGARLYRTGDMAVLLPDGNVELLGRMDFQVKIRGFRIEPGEVEAALNQHPTVQQSAVTPKKAPAGDKRLVAYVVAAPGAEVDTGELRRFLQDRLPDYMVPSAFVKLEALPITPNGKIDRKALPEPDWSAREVADEYVAPRTPVEQVLANIWSKVLGVEKVGVHDDFFALGGHSLLATQLVSRIRDTFKVELPLRHIFESPTVATLAEQIEIAQRTVGGTPPPPLVPAPRDGEIPLSFAQQRLWFLDQFEPNSPFYNIPEAVRLHGPVDPAVLERCLNEIVRRHEALRTTFKTVDGKPQQVIAPELYVPFPVVDLTSLPKAEREVEARRLAEREAQRPFDLAHGPLLRARLVRLDEDDHVVLLTIHHIIGDDWSTQVLVQEMALLYDAFAHNRPSPLPELPIQYADYAHWQRNWLQGEALEAQLDYWRKQLEGAPPLLELPTVRPRPAVPTYRGDYVTFQLSPELTDGIRTLAQREGATLFMTLLAAFKTLLYRYSGQTDICIGTPVAGRNRAELENLIGFFINTLVLRSDLSGEPSFRDLLKQVRETALSAYAHQDVPFEMLIDALDLEREMSHTPLFQVMFALQNAPVKVRQVSDLTLSSFEAHSGTSKFDMTLFAVEHEDRISGALEFSTELWDRSTIERLLRHFETLLEAIVRDPAEPISRLPLLTEAERYTLLVEWNSRTLDYPADECLHHAFERRAAETPDAEAVVYEGRSLTFRELNERANKLAHALRKRGVGPETLVGLAMDRSPEMIVGLLGILKAGGAYVPLDPSYPLDRLSYMLENAAAPALVTTAEHVASLPAEGRTVLRLDADWPEIEQESAENPDSGVTASNLAYVIYTSGSTGQPKGVMVEHRSVQNLAAALDHLVYRHLPQRRLRISLNAPLSFDASMQQLCMMLTRGHTLVIIPQAARLDGEALLRTIREQKIELVDCVPSQLKLLLAAGLLSDGGPAPLVMLPGGEAIDEALWAMLRAAPATEFFNMYGPTECTVDSTIGHVRACERPTIGRGVPNARMYILDAHREPVPVGVPGELYIGGAGVARGYLNRPDLTAERFLPDPFSDEPGARMYRTGDLCRWLPDGNIDFLGRIDHQVKVRGFRIELGEIEAVLAQHPAVKEAVVLAREDEPGHKRLVGYVVADGEPPSVSALREHLGRNLPDYMVPSAFVFLDALPLTPNGKVDRRALPAPSGERPELESEFVAARDEVERQLAEIWAEVLGLEKVGVHDNFFELGGDSILSIQVIARANQAGLRLSPRQLFQHPTVAGLASVAGRGPAVQAEQGLVEGPVPLTPIQHWFFEQEIPNRHHWNQSLLLEVKGQLNGEALKQAVGALLRHHDALRLRFRHGPAGWDEGDFAEILAELKDGMKEMADDLAEVRSDFAEMRSDFAEMRSDFAEMQDDFDEFLADMEEDF